MREIKFRAWDIEKQQYDYKPLVPSPIVMVNVLFIQKGWILEQFTGLSDKNGKEIYEGDICKNGDWEPDAHAYNYRIEEIRWDIDNGLWLGSNYNCDGMTCEVIGNIHSSPELLKEKSND